MIGDPSVPAHNFGNPGVCPGCGRCNTCGRPYHAQPLIPWTQPLPWVVGPHNNVTVPVGAGST